MDNICNIEQMQTLIRGFKKYGTSIIDELMQNFPFENMPIISSDDEELIRLHTILLSRVSRSHTFFEHSHALTDTFNFLWKNFYALKNAQRSNVFPELLILLKLIIKRTKFNRTGEDFIKMNIESLSKLIVFIPTLNIFTKRQVNDYLVILSDLTKMKDASPAISKFLGDIFEKLQSLGAVCELISFCKIILELSTTTNDIAKQCVSWLLIQGLNDLFLNHVDTVQKLMQGMNFACRKYYCSETDITSKVPQFYEQIQKNYVEKLHSILDHILNLTNNPKLREESLKLVAFLISTCNCQNLDDVFNKLLDLPIKVSDWPKTKSDMFFNICAIQFGDKGKSFWSASEVFRAISVLIYSHHRYSIKKNVLKSICYIFPFMLREFPTVITVAVGDSLLFLLEKFKKHLDEILSYDMDQLVWIMVKGTDVLKKFAISSWLQNGDLDIIIKAFNIYDFSPVLFDLLIDEEVEEMLARRVIQVANKIQNIKLSEKISYSLPIFFQSALIFNRLLRCNPGVLQNEESLTKLCTFMSIMIFYIKEEYIFREACLYLKKLIVALKNRDDIVELACSAFYNIDLYLLKLFFAKDDTALEILGLLKALLLVQKRHHVELEVKVRTDFSIQLKGSTEKLAKCLDLLQIIVTSNKLALGIEKSSVLNLALAIYGLYSQHDLSNQCLTCLIEMFKRNHELALPAITSLFIESNCNLEVQISWPSFISFLTYWLKIVRKLKPRRPILHLGVLVNYIDRVTNLPEAQKLKLKKKISGIMILPDARNPLKIELQRLKHEYRLFKSY